MAQHRPAVWDFALSPVARMRRLGRRVHKIARAHYWFPHVPLSLALAVSGAFIVWLGIRFQESVLLSDFPQHILELRPASLPYVLIGVGMIIMSVGLLFRSRLSWIIALVLTSSTILSAALLGHSYSSHLLIYYDGVLLVALLLAYHRFDRSSLAAGTLFAITSTLMLLIYAVFGSLYLGAQFSPPIKDIVTAFYFSVVTMGTVGYGDIIPSSREARLFTISVIILGLAVFATSVTAIITPMIGRIMSRKAKRMKRSNHFIVIGSTPLAYNTYRELKRRNQAVTFILPQQPPSGEVDDADLIVGDANSLETLRQADAVDAQAVIAMRVDDSDNAFISLAVKELKSKAKTVVAINDSKHIERIKLVQPDIVIAPEVLGGELLAMLLSGEPITSEFVAERFLNFQRPAPPKPSTP